MTIEEADHRRRERATRLKIWMAGKSSRNKSLTDKLCRFLINRATSVDPEKDFLRDPIIDQDQGYDPDELARFERGETS